MSDLVHDVPGRHFDAHSRSYRAAWALLAAIGVFAMALGRVVPAGPGRAVVVLPVIAFLPGFALVRLVRGRAHDDAVLTVTFGVGASLALLIAESLILNAAGLKLTAAAVGVAAAATLVLLAAAGGARNLELRIPLVRAGDRGAATRTVAVAAGVVVVLALFVAGATVAAHRISQPRTAPSTSLSVAETWASMPAARSTVAGEQVAVPLVLHTSGPGGSYTLQATVDGRQVSSEQVVVAAKGSWQGSVTVVAPSGPDLHRVVVEVTTGSGVSADQSIVVYLRNAPGAKG